MFIQQKLGRGLFGGEGFLMRNQLIFDAGYLNKVYELCLETGCINMVKEPDKEEYLEKD